MLCFGERVGYGLYLHKLGDGEDSAANFHHFLSQATLHSNISLAGSFAKPVAAFFNERNYRCMLSYLGGT